MLKLFPLKERIDLDAAFHNENTYNYYNRSARKEISKVRNLLNEWFSTYPENEQNELKARFKKTFSSAFFELFIYQLFSNLGFQITIHPKIPGSSKKPDFLLIKGECQFYLEAKEARDISQEEQAQNNMINQLYDQLSKVRLSNFLIYIEELNLKSKKQPATKNIIKQIEEEATKHDPIIITKQIEREGLEGNKKFTYEDDDLKLIISLIPIIKDTTDPDSERAIGMYPFESINGGAQDSIKDSFFKKAKRYGILDKPYFICINAIGIKGNAEFDAENALWGSLSWTWSTNPLNRDGRWTRSRDGIFLDETGPRSQHVSGVLITKAFESNLHNVPYWFAKHPYPKTDFNFEVFDLSYFFVENGQIQKKEGKSTGQILGLESNWLYS